MAGALVHRSQQQQDEEEDDSFHEAETRSLQAVDEYPSAAAAAAASRMQFLEGMLADAFTTVSALKSAYIQLQAAHSPYDPDKLRTADRMVIAELRKLSELKHAFRANNKVKGQHQQQVAPSSKDRNLDALARKVAELQAGLKEKQGLVETYEGFIEACQREATQKEEEIGKLKEALKRAESKREKLERKLLEATSAERMNGGTAGVGKSAGSLLSPSLFQAAAQGAREQAFSFAKVLVGLMKAAEWDLEAAASSIQPGVVFYRPSQTRFAFDSYVCSRMFNGFDNENFYLSGSLTSILDPDKHRQECLVQFQDMRQLEAMELVSASPTCLFGKFCHRKYLQLVHERMEESFFGGMQHRGQVLAGGHPRSSFYQKFLELARCVWLLHRLAFAFKPTVSIFQVKRGTEFHPEFMESVMELETVEQGLEARTVAFTVMPGFKLENSVVKCLVCLESPGHL